ncbi:292_t:CDS:2 [Acaulospora morrowiae]|uniref:292_t:CDS:1 n=1 Tax=Acaulospora morrowiae TaxID=94023 RepID=A0A9N9EK28_9GLOM|nr:292_t:CDS:2 [Acaulospora morrowiae]
MNLSDFKCIICDELKHNPQVSQCCPKFYCTDCIKKIENICSICNRETSFKEYPALSRLVEAKLIFESNLTNTIFNKIRRKFSRNNSNKTKSHLPSNDHIGDTFKITVLNIEGKKVNIYVKESDTIGALKDKIKEEEGIEIEYQRLIFRGRQLEDHNAISYYNIKKDHVVHMVNRYISG